MKEIKIPELLVPVGGMEQLYAAVENGADAVYFGGKLFNARQYADNFDMDDLKHALDYAHIRGVNVYLTMNILISDEEMEEALNFVGQAYELGIDALIVQDLGLAEHIKKYYPDLSLHLSTQGTTYNLEGVELACRLGFKRVVLARELSIEEISAITQNTDTEIEVFVHGALCISYSGQCLMSSMIGGRSGNRGKCAQPCRLPYQIGKVDSGLIKSDKAYYLSPKDLSGLSLLNNLVKANISSLKIEGRMKSPEYVAAVTRIYRKYLDLSIANKKYKIDSEDQKVLMQVFNRGGFTTGYLDKKQGADLISRERAKHWGVYLGKTISYDKRTRKVTLKLEENLSIGDGIEIVNEELSGNIITYIECKGEKIKDAKIGDVVTIGSVSGKILSNQKVYKISNKSLNKSLQESFSGKKYFRKYPLKAVFTGKLGEKLKLTISDNQENSVTVKSDYVTEKAIKRAITNEEISKQLNKTGSTPFEFNQCEIDIDNDIAIPISELNAIRREALERMEVQRKNKYSNRRLIKIELEDSQEDLKKQSDVDQKYTVYLYKWNKKLLNVLKKVDRVYIPFKAFIKNENMNVIEELRSSGCEVIVSLPSITRGNYDRLIKTKLTELGDIDGVLIGNISHIDILKDVDIPLYGDYSLNIFNSKSVETISKLGLKGVALSHELTLKQIENLHYHNIEIETAVYGRLPVMVSEHCVVGAEVSDKGNEKCNLCKKGDYYLKDRINKEFPILGDEIDCRSTILNADKLLVPNIPKKLSNSRVNLFRLYVHDETEEELEKIIALFKSRRKNIDSLNATNDDYTKGHYYRGV